MVDNIPVTPSKDGTAVPIATDVIGSVHYPVYKLALGKDGTAMLVTEDGLLVQLTTTAHVQQENIYTGLEAIVKELKITNLHLSILTDNYFTHEDL